MLFQEHYDTFRDFIRFTAWREKYNRNLPEGKPVDIFPTDGYLERIGLDEVKMIATIFNVGMAAGEGDFNSNDELYQKYYSELEGRFGDTRAEYIGFLLGCESTYTDEYLFIRGLEEFSIDIGIICSKRLRYEED